VCACDVGLCCVLAYVLFCGMLWCGGVVLLDVIRVGKSPRAVVGCELC